MTSRDNAWTLENPFFHRNAIRDPDYFSNRTKEVKRLLQTLGKGQSVSVIGPRKIGKTSLLFYVSQSEVMRQYGLNPTSYLFVHINCEGLSNLSREALYFLILEEIIEEASRQGHSFETPSYPDSFISFERNLVHILESDHLKLALLIDEFEWLTENRYLGSEFFSGLRSLATRFDIAYVVASQRPLSKLIDTRESSAFFNIFSLLNLGLFDEPGGKELIESYMRRSGSAFDQQATNMVLEMGGGHPFFLQVACYWAWELQHTKGAPLEYKDSYLLKRSMYGDIESHFEYYWNHLTSQQQYVLAALPVTKDDKVYGEELESLESFCLVAKKNGQHEYFTPLLREFVRRREVPNMLQAGPFVVLLPERTVLVEDEKLDLSDKLFDLLTYLLQHQGRVVSNEELDREVIASSAERQDYHFVSDDRVKSAIRDLRNKLKDVKDAATCIVNKRGVGYMFQIPTGEEST